MKMIYYAHTERICQGFNTVANQRQLSFDNPININKLIISYIIEFIIIFTRKSILLYLTA